MSWIGHGSGRRCRRHHVLIRILRWMEGRPPVDSHKASLMQAGFAASLPYRRLKQRAQGTAATASVSAVPATRRRNHWNRRSRPRNACGVKRRRRPGIAGAAGGNSGNIGLYPLGLGPLKCPFSKGFVSGFLIFKSPIFSEPVASLCLLPAPVRARTGTIANRSSGVLLVMPT